MCRKGGNARGEIGMEGRGQLCSLALNPTRRPFGVWEGVGRGEGNEGRGAWGGGEQGGQPPSLGDPLARQTKAEVVAGSLAELSSAGCFCSL